MAERYFFVEGKCEQKLVKALQLPEPMLLPGKVEVINVIQEVISSSILGRIKENSQIVFIFNTDTAGNISVLNENIKRIKLFCRRPHFIMIPQVKNIEDELKRACKITHVTELTGSKHRTIKDFKTDFCAMRPEDIRTRLLQHHFDLEKLWSSVPDGSFSPVTNNGYRIKTGS